MMRLEKEEYQRLCEENHVTHRSCSYCGRGIREKRITEKEAMAELNKV